MMLRRSAKFASCWKRLMRRWRMFVFIDGRRIGFGCGIPGASIFRAKRRALPQLDSREPALSLPKGRLSPQGHRGKLGQMSSQKSGDALQRSLVRLNAWAKYSNWRHDNAIGTLMAAAAGVEFVFPYHRGKRVMLEGGSIM